MSILSSPNALLSKEELLLRLEETEETLRAIRSGEVDALVVSGTHGDQVFTLKDATLPYQILIEQMNEGALTLSLQGMILYCNARFAEILGLSMETVLGKSFFHFVLPVDLTQATTLLEQRPEGQSRGELTLLGGQREVPVGVSLKEIKLDGELRFGVLITDLTERKQTELELKRHKENLEMLVQERTKELQESHSQLSRAEQIGEIGSWEWRIPENRVTWSDGLYKLFGLLPQEFGATYESYLEQFHPEDREHVRQVVNNTLQVGGVFEFESRIFCKDGQIRHLHTRGETLSDELGQTLRILGIAIDITERKQAEKHIAYQAQLLANVNDAIVGSDEQYRLTAWNAGAESLYGWKAEEVLGQNGIELLRTEWTQEEANAMRHKIAQLGRWRGEATQLHKDGTRIPVEVSSIALRDESGKITGYVSVNRDITERKQAEAAVQRMTQDLLRSNAELEQFAYVASHDLQEPLRMVSSYMQLLSKRYQGKLDSDADEFIAFAVDGSKRMQNLINDLLTYSRLGTRGEPMVLISCEKVLDAALMNLQLAIEESHTTITRELLPTAFCDPMQLAQVFQNLLGNSIKFRGPRAPHIHISAKRQESEWIFSVRDNGIGLDPKFRERIFDIFQRLHDRASYPGTGIGLAICKRIIQRHNGRIWVESQPGKGSTFYFTLPARATDAT